MVQLQVMAAGRVSYNLVDFSRDYGFIVGASGASVSGGPQALPPCLPLIILPHLLFFLHIYLSYVLQVFATFLT